MSKGIIRNRKYRDKRSWLIIPAYALIPLSQVIITKSINPGIIMSMIVYLLISLFTFIYFNKKVMVEIKDGFLYIYTGIGLYDPSKIDIQTIDSVLRKAKTFLSIYYDNDKIVSIELPPKVALEIEFDIINYLEKL